MNGQGFSLEIGSKIHQLEFVIYVTRKMDNDEKGFKHFKVFQYSSLTKLFIFLYATMPMSIEFHDYFTHLIKGHGSSCDVMQNFVIFAIQNIFKLEEFSIS